MKPTVTWAVMANSSHAYVAENNGPGRGFAEVAGREYRAPDPVAYADQPGVTQSSKGPGRAALEKNDPKRLAEEQFARALGSHLKDDLAKGRFDRLVLVAAPHMLGELRAALPDQVRAAVVAEVDKDLTQVPARDLSARLGHVIVA